MMKVIMYTQNESATIKNTIVVDGVQYNDFATGIAAESFRFINDKSGETTDYVWLIGLLKKCGLGISHNFQFKKDKTGVFVKGCFKEIDELGRNMPFLFYMKSADVKEVCATLKEYAGNIGRSCNEADLKIVDNMERVIKAGGFGLIILIIILWIL